MNLFILFFVSSVSQIEDRQRSNRHASTTNCFFHNLTVSTPKYWNSNIPICIHKVDFNTLIILNSLFY